MFLDERCCCSCYGRGITAAANIHMTLNECAVNVKDSLLQVTTTVSTWLHSSKMSSRIVTPCSGVVTSDIKADQFRNIYFSWPPLLLVDAHRKCVENV